MTHRNLPGPPHRPLRLARHARTMTLTTIITLNAVLGTAVAYGLHHLLAHGILGGREDRHELISVTEREAERRAA
jgi:hypothetical protein